MKYLTITFIMYVLLVICGCGGGTDSKSTTNTTSERFIDNNDGTIYDSYSKLTWLKTASCFGTQTYDNAISKVSTLATGGCGLTDGSKAGDWRVPIIDELSIFRDTGYRSWNLLEGVGFTNVGGTFKHWSTTPDDRYVNNVRCLTSIWDVESSLKTNYLHVWPVKVSK